MKKTIVKPTPQQNRILGIKLAAIRRRILKSGIITREWNVNRVDNTVVVNAPISEIRALLKHMKSKQKPFICKHGDGTHWGSISFKSQS
jgi:hypothetical protein